MLIEGQRLVKAERASAESAVAHLRETSEFHNGCSSISFADGHVESHKWLDPRTEMSPQYAREPVPNDPDIAWLQEHSCSQK